MVLRSLKIDLNLRKISCQFNKGSNKSYFPTFDVKYPEKLHNLQNYLSFLPEKMRIKKVEKLVTNYMTKMNMLFILET